MVPGSRRRGLCMVLALVAAAACATAFAAGGATALRPLVVDPATFTALPAERSSPRASRPVDGGQGPRIVLRLPLRDAVYRVGEPMALVAELLPAADGAAPDMGTLRVRVRQGRRGKDLTAAVRPYVAGTALHVPAVDFAGHAGELRFEIDVTDEQGRLGEVAFRVAFKLELRDALRGDGET